MYNNRKPNRATLSVNSSKEGETIEAKVRRIRNNKEPIKDGAPRLFTERKDGVKPEYNIRADKWEAAVNVTTQIANSHSLKREERIAEKTWDTLDDKGRKEFAQKFPNNPLSKTVGGAESTPKA